MAPSPPPKFNTQIHTEACEWFVDSRAGDMDEAGRRRFDEWLRRSPEHLGAYLEVAAIWSESNVLDASGQYDRESLILAAANPPGNVVALPLALSEPIPPIPNAQNPARDSVPETLARKRRPTRRLHSPAAAVAAGIAAFAVGSLIGYLVLRDPEYATAIGEQRSLELADGSAVTLNARSRIRIHYSNKERNVELLEGEALFRVHKNAARPFIVTSGDTRVRAVGTAFDVNQSLGGVVVTVVEGRVSVLSAESAKSATARVSPAVTAGPRALERTGTLLLSAGGQLVSTPTEVRVSDHANVTGATAWTQRHLVFESASLAEVAEEFNRYNEHRLVISDPALDTFHISGVFSSTDPASLIRFLRTRPGLRVLETPTEIHIEK